VSNENSTACPGSGPGQAEEVARLGEKVGPLPSLPESESLDHSSPRGVPAALIPLSQCNSTRAEAIRTTQTKGVGGTLLLSKVHRHRSKNEKGG
jgi:hypothetical protein